MGSWGGIWTGDVSGLEFGTGSGLEICSGVGSKVVSISNTCGGPGDWAASERSTGAGAGAGEVIVSGDGGAGMIGAVAASGTFILKRRICNGTLAFLTNTKRIKL